ASLTKAGAGTLTANRIRAGSLVITAGTLRIFANGSSTGVSSMSTLSIDPAAALDLSDNDLIVNAGNFSAIRAQVLSGFGATTGGITSSTSNGSQILALFDNALIGASTWQGHTLSASAIVGKYTFFGDVS